MAELYKYENGLRVVVETFSKVRSVACGVWVGAGCCFEDERTNGISHFIEHMLYKGTLSRSSFQIADSFERLGASVNAFTGKDNTCFYYKAIDENNQKCFEILSDIFFNSVFCEAELAREKGVVIEEINMTLDQPEDLCFDLLAKSIYGSHPLSQPILGSIANVSSFNKAMIEEYMQNIYNPANCVISFAGNITLNEAKKLIDEYFVKNFRALPREVSYPRVEKIERNFLYQIREFEQANILLRFNGCAYNAPDLAVYSVINMILGGGMSSRLFQSVREKLGLAYSIYSGMSAQKEGGSFVVFYNVNPKNIGEASRAVSHEIVRFIKEGITREELERVKTQLKCSLIFGQESVQTMMNTIGKVLLTTGECYDPNQRLDNINRVTVDDVFNLAQAMFDPKSLCGAYVGKEGGVDILSELSI